MKRKIMAALLVGLLMLLPVGCSAGSKDNTDEPGQSEPPQAEATIFNDINLQENNINLNGHHSDLSLSPDGKQVAFSGYSFDPADLAMENKMVLGDLTTGRAETFEGITRVLAWLNDGKTILFADDTSIGLLDIESGNKKEIEKVFSYASVSPDGKTIAYTVRGNLYPWDNNSLSEDKAGLWLYNIASGEKKQLTNNADEWYPLWYPDSKKIFYFCDLGEALGDGAGHLQGMAVITAEGGQPEVLDYKEGKFRNAQWIVPGKTMYILGGWDDGFYHSVLDLEQGKYTDLGETNAGTVPPQVYFVDKNNGHLFKADNGNIEVIDSTGKALRQITLPDNETNSFNFTVSPQGDHIAYVQGEYGRMAESTVKGNQVKVISLDGGSPVTLTEDFKYNESIIWTADGTSIISLQAENRDGTDIITAFKIIPVK